MRILTPGFVNHCTGRLLNIHLPCYPLSRGCTRTSGRLRPVASSQAPRCKVTAELDHGPILAQAVLPVLPDDNADTLAARVRRKSM
ncbi:MAG: hypothetical protein IPG42_11495 [Betaproteobacteria bacterium]|nr:hypothetical protein [Betaproteobacteria bacterium]